MKRGFWSLALLAGLIVGCGEEAPTVNTARNEKAAEKEKMKYGAGSTGPAGK
jgi:hypothetical protein